MKYHIGDKCKITQNLMAPFCIGALVTITEIYSSIDRDFYSVEFEDGMKGYASETCLQLIKTCDT